MVDIERATAGERLGGGLEGEVAGEGEARQRAPTTRPASSRLRPRRRPLPSSACRDRARRSGPGAERPSVNAATAASRALLGHLHDADVALDLGAARGSSTSPCRTCPRPGSASRAPCRTPSRGSPPASPSLRAPWRPPPSAHRRAQGKLTAKTATKLARATRPTRPAEPGDGSSRGSSDGKSWSSGEAATRANGKNEAQCTRTKRGARTNSESIKHAEVSLAHLRIGTEPEALRPGAIQRSRHGLADKPRL